MAMRKIDISDYPEVEKYKSPPPSLDFVAIDDLIVDERYQRSVERTGSKNIQKIAANFDWAKFSPIMVSKRETGELAIIDGQHRAHAAALCGIDTVPAIISELSIEQEAEAFTWVNGTVTALTANQVFKAALAAFEPWAVQCDAVATRAGCRLMAYNKSHKDKRPGEIFCIGVVRKMVEAEQQPFLVAVLRGVQASVIKDDIRYYAAFGLNALVPAAIATGVQNPAVIASFLNENDLDDVAGNVRRVLEQPEYRTKNFKSLFAESVKVLLKQHVKKEIA